MKGEVDSNVQLEQSRWLSIMRCLHDPANVQQTSSNRNAGRLLDRVNTL